MHNIKDVISNYPRKHSGANTRSIDGTGEVPSVDVDVAQKIKDFVIEKYPNVKKILDVGAGQGYLQAEFEKGDFEVVSIEGSENVPFVANPDYRLQVDFCAELPSEFEKHFDLVVSFECIEHVCAGEQESFWDNIKKVSNKALVGIHAANGEGGPSGHVFIRHQEYWDSFFDNIAMNHTLLGAYDWNVWPTADCSLFYELEW